MGYTLVKSGHGYIIYDNPEKDMLSKHWAYSTLDEALEGLRELMEPQEEIV